MAYALAPLIFVALSAACWAVPVALYRSTHDAPDPAAALTCFVPFPAGYLAGAVVWVVPRSAASA